MLMRCGSMAMTGAATMGGMMMLAGLAPFLAGVGVGAAAVCGACYARKAMERRGGWRDQGSTGTAPLSEPLPGDDAATA
ncbi:MAG TPA: hypothetical protein VE684_07865 [Crenalkalicoccus sp.]|nr:hypothetical protein [Crenalkalicoccus sp.]